MGFLDEVRSDREPLALVLKKHRGIRKIVEDLYPDRAHFIYELLQNAEDAGAAQAAFVLSEQSISFEHDGRPFTEDDILGITDIGEGSKVGQDDKIGRFGVGFKAVFAYSETPHVWSPTFSFKITELVLPTEIPARPELGKLTRFEFPFNNPKKSAPDAFAEVEAGLNELAETTLLFLSRLRSIRWRVPNHVGGEVLRLEHSETHIEVIKKSDGDRGASSHFLRFVEPAVGLEKQRIAVAFALDCLPEITAFDAALPLVKQLKIIPANPGRVAVFFPADKEASGLRFHLHAPFVPELSRASIKDTRANDPLFCQLAELSAKSLHQMRDFCLLTTDLLAVLPNPQDTIPQRYQCIRSSIVNEMNEQALTPTYSKSHAPAKLLLQAKASLKECFSADDVTFLVGPISEPAMWAVSAPQKNSNADRFLSGLAIKGWDIEDFVRLLELKASDKPRFVGGNYVTTPDAAFMTWLGTKPAEWHQQMYALLYKELAPNAMERLQGVRMVRLAEGRHSIGAKCYFAVDGVKGDLQLPWVDDAAYTSGRSKGQQDDAKSFLAKIGVRDVGEVEQIQALLDQRYTAGAFKPVAKDLKRFVAFVEKDPSRAAMFGAYFIFERIDEKWGQPSQVFLDSPVHETGLSAYHDKFKGDTARVLVSPRYADCGIPIEKFVAFARAVGVQVALEIDEAQCQDNPEWPYLREVGGERYTRSINQDYNIPSLGSVLASPTLELSKLIWQTMCRLPHNSKLLCARYQKNDANGSRTAHSQLVHVLRKCAWVPQRSGGFVRPCDADRNLLPSGFPFDAGQEWIGKVDFGQGDRIRAEQAKKLEAATNAVAKELGFTDAETLDRARSFVALPMKEQERLLSEWKARSRTNLPEHQPTNPERRAERIAQRAANAPVRNVEQRSRAVSVGLGDVKQEVEPYLCQQYTNADGEMICQICKAPLPFKLDSGSYFFEKVEFLAELKKWHLENYLSLCPNHSAMFRFANGSRPTLKEAFLKMTNNQLVVTLAQNEFTIYFTKTHIADLSTVIEVDETPTTEGQQ